MDAGYIRALYDYNYWARDLLLRAAADLPHEEYVRPNGFSCGSIRGIFLHAAWAEAGWLARWTGRPRVDDFADDQFPALTDLVGRWRKEEAAMRRFLGELTAENLESGVSYVSSRSGRQYTDPLWQLLVHVVNHATQHRAEAAEALTMAGHSPGDLDLLDFFREQGGRL